MCNRKFPNISIIYRHSFIARPLSNPHSNVVYTYIFIRLSNSYVVLIDRKPLNKAVYFMR